MSIDLVNLCLKQNNLSQSEKHILTVLCYRANKNNHVYSSIERLSEDCSCSIKTIERTLKNLRDKNILIYTNKLAPNSKSIPIYSINLTHGQNGGALNLRTDNLSFTDGHFVHQRTDKMGIRIENKEKDYKKDNGKDFFSSYQLTHIETKELLFCHENNYNLGSDFKHLQNIYDEMKENFIAVF